MRISSTQCRMARAALNLGVRDLADLAKVSPNTVTRFERGEHLQERTVEAIAQTLDRAGIIFIPNGGEGHGVRLRRAEFPEWFTQYSAELARRLRREGIEREDVYFLAATIVKRLIDDAIEEGLKTDESIKRHVSRLATNAPIEQLPEHAIGIDNFL